MTSPNKDTLKQLTLQYTRFECSPGVLVQHITACFTADQEVVFNHLVRQLEDPERRASLAHAYFTRIRNILTHCCGAKVCYVCKRNGHHPLGDACDSLAFDETQCLLQCRKCQLMLVKVEGCNSVRCYCGFTLNWDMEIHMQSLSRRQLLPFKLHNDGLASVWLDWKGFMVLEDLRFEFITRMARRYKHTLKGFISRSFARQKLRRIHPALYEELRLAFTIQCFRGVRKQFRALISPPLSKIRRKLLLEEIQDRMRWKRYYVDHPEAAHEIEEEEQDFFSIALDDDDE